MESQKKRSAAKKDYIYNIEKEGAAQLILFGFPNVGKSSIVSALTNADCEIADYPFTTQKPLPGMIKFEDIQFQILDTPAYTDESNETGLFYMVRNGDLIILVVDLSDEPALQLEMIFDEMSKRGIAMLGREEGEKADHLKKRVLIVGNKCDINGSNLANEEVKSKYGIRFPILAISAEARINLKEFKREIYQASGIVRVYTKIPGKDPDTDNPFILRKGSTVLSLAEHVHKDFLSKLKFARIWGSEKYNGQKVKRDYQLKDGDIIEIHI